MKAHEIAYGQRLLRGQAPSYERLQARLAGDGSQPHDQRHREIKRQNAASP